MAYEQKYNNNICRICNNYKATIFWELSSNKYDPYKKNNICAKCHSFFFD